MPAHDNTYSKVQVDQLPGLFWTGAVYIAPGQLERSRWVYASPSPGVRHRANICGTFTDATVRPAEIRPSYTPMLPQKNSGKTLPDPRRLSLQPLTAYLLPESQQTFSTWTTRLTTTSSIARSESTEFMNEALYVMRCCFPSLQ